MPYIAPGEIPPLSSSPLVLLGDVTVLLGSKENVTVVREASASKSPDACVIVDLAVCVDPGVDEDDLEKDLVGADASANSPEALMPKWPCMMWLMYQRSSRRFCLQLR